MTVGETVGWSVGLKEVGVVVLGMAEGRAEGEALGR